MTLPANNRFTAGTARAFVEEFELGPWSSGVLSGTTVAISDGIDIEERFTGCGNAAWKNSQVVAAKNATAVDLLLSSGAQCLGKARVGEFGFTLLGDSEAATRPVNGAFPDRLIGGAAHGISSAVSCGLVDFGVGIDCGGTVLVPASNCGLTGWRCSGGIVSGAGFMSIAPSFDSVAVVCRSPSLLPAIAESLLSRSISAHPGAVEVFVLKDALKLLDKPAAASFEVQLKSLANFGVSVSGEISLAQICQGEEASLDDCQIAFEQLLSMEIWNTLGGWVESVMPSMGDEARQRLFTARHLDRSQLPGLVRKRVFYAERLISFLGANRFLCLPTAPSPPATTGTLSKSAESNRYLRTVLSLAAPAVMAGCPQITLHTVEPDVPVTGVSFIAAKGNDPALIALCSCNRS